MTEKKPSVPVSYTKKADLFAHFNQVTTPNIPNAKRIAELGLREGIDFPSRKIQKDWKSITDLGMRCAIVYLDSLDVRRAMRKYPELFVVDSYGQWFWPGYRPMWQIVQSLKEFKSFKVDYLPFEYEEIAKNTHGGSSRSDSCEQIACAKIERHTGLKLEWTGWKKRGERGAYHPDGVHYNENGEIDFKVEVKGLSGMYGVNPKRRAAKLKALAGK